ncbi:threonine--tRNA ligase [Enterococcus dongliensis]|uniref:Threonine--tRNA ligase n=1 Tax=Enterococcus dongliensis TaxID=2559925 RepID=A0ABU3EKS6_9ENTE|nr:threonine--tRNA ligase [Enterococcus dongliensis]MDT2595450.1 threonine--tRNA ligase [Enterococcus dongliensis]MDT2603336.1 threonine--tRNA ligase [Enterococcus dongliensis]MDT2633697.1 threonine--tRNA ligase [Enterococcus dongliensis]MDT2639797.1 threonine--tRNA ligase [Enterococcus dongliensis]MDT2641687.1 threonine--tRNA ligase [Enterococcus dongliensis]
MSKEIEIVLPDGSKQKVRENTTLFEIKNQLLEEAVVGSIDGVLVDLSTPVKKNSEIAFYDCSTPEGTTAICQLVSLLLEEAIKSQYPEALFAKAQREDQTIWIDLRVDKPLSALILKDLEHHMKQKIKADAKIESTALTVSEAKEVFKDNELKLFALSELADDRIIFVYSFGDVTEFFLEPAALEVAAANYFSLLKVSGAYWQGNPDNEMLQRVTGVVFAEKAQLLAHLDYLEESEKRSHQKLGKELDLFMFSEEAPGMPFYLENGLIIRNELQKFLRELQAKYDYKEVKTPLILNQRLWERSGHWDHYKNNMYFTKVADEDYALKPMNCPGHCLIFKDRKRSYRDLPMRMAEFGQVHRHEFSGALNGLLRVRTFCQDDAHIFVRRDQIEQEIALALKIIDEVYKIFGFEYAVELSTRPDDFMGEIELWDEAEASLGKVLTDLGYKYNINEGDGTFYGPKIDIYIKDALNRSHQCATVQLDFQMPGKFDLSYIDENNQEAQPVMIHRAVFGSLDRFLGILIEHYAGAFPLWLAPKQVALLSVAQTHKNGVEKLFQEFHAAGIRVEKDLRNEKLGKKIREAELRKIPYILVIGDKELAEGTFAVRKHGSDGVKQLTKIEFMELLKQQIQEKNHQYY